jgi:hypothetical protein
MLITAFIFSFFLGCSNSSSHTKAELATGAELQILMEKGEHTVTIEEVLDSGGYTYIKAREEGLLFWIAGPQSALQKGETLTLGTQMWMDDFKSSTLNKTFDAIMFVQEFAPAKSAKAQTKLPYMKALSSINGSISIKELYSDAKKFKSTSVTLHARIVKISKGIMGKNWIHLIDGSSQSDDGVITATTEEENFSVDDLVLVTGTLTTDKDFGYGYFYPVILEEASFTAAK